MKLDKTKNYHTNILMNCSTKARQTKKWRRPITVLFETQISFVQFLSQFGWVFLRRTSVNILVTDKQIKTSLSLSHASFDRILTIWRNDFISLRWLMRSFLLFLILPAATSHANI